jgi:MFS family permease
MSPPTLGDVAPRSPLVRPLAGAAVATTAGALPVFLLGGLAVLVRAELGFSETQLGLATTVYFAGSTLAAAPAGWAAERLGARRTTLVGVGLAGLALVGIALGARTYLMLLPLLALGGAANALAQLGANLALAREVPPGRQGLAFGVKQAAVPLATLLAGLAVPVVGLTVGWRWAFGGAALVVLAYPPLAPRSDVPPRRAHAAMREGDAAAGPLLILAVAGALGAAALNSFGAFAVESAVALGWSAGAAGALYALGSGCGIVARVANGWQADRRGGRHLPIVAALLTGGAIGVALLGTAGTVAVGTIVVFAAGWSWPGLFNFAVVRLNPHAPAAATGITQTGVFVGGMLGPLGFGALVEASSYPVAWRVAALALVGAAALVLLGRARLRRDPAVRRIVEGYAPASSASAPSG